MEQVYNFQKSKSPKVPKFKPSPPFPPEEPEPEPEPEREPEVIPVPIMAAVPRISTNEQRLSSIEVHAYLSIWTENYNPKMDKSFQINKIKS